MSTHHDSVKFIKLEDGKVEIVFNDENHKLNKSENKIFKCKNCGALLEYTLEISAVDSFYNIYPCKICQWRREIDD